MARAAHDRPQVEVTSRAGLRARLAANLAAALGPVPGARKAALEQLLAAKTEATRARRLTLIVEESAAGRPPSSGDRRVPNRRASTPTR